LPEAIGFLGLRQLSASQHTGWEWFLNFMPERDAIFSLMARRHSSPILTQWR
jgi:hypothetical protein